MSRQWIGLLENEDVNVRNTIVIDGTPVKKAILLVFMPTCPHCKEPKRDMVRLNVRKYGVEKLAIDASGHDGLADRVPRIFGFPKEDYTVPRLYVIRNGRPIKQLKTVTEFDPVRDFATKAQTKKKKSSVRKTRSQKKK